jgi:hypothetical protein
MSHAETNCKELCNVADDELKTVEGGWFAAVYAAYKGAKMLNDLTGGSIDYAAMGIKF